MGSGPPQRPLRIAVGVALGGVIGLGGDNVGTATGIGPVLGIARSQA